MKDEYPEMGLATVYRTLQLLYEIQLIDRIHFNDGCIRYEIGHIFDGDSKHSHHHLICRTCGRVMPFEDDFLGGSGGTDRSRYRFSCVGS